MVHPGSIVEITYGDMNRGDQPEAHRWAPIKVAAERPLTLWHCLGSRRLASPLP
jgi:hypothetical protein